MTQTLFLIRGLPGAGKTSLLMNYIDVAAFAADDYFTNEFGEYEFNPSLLPKAHARCQMSASEALKDGHDVAVHNTFTQRWEMQPYIEMAEENGARLTVIDLFDGGLTDEELEKRNTHGVPKDAIARMRARYEHDWKSENPRAPWERK